MFPLRNARNPAQLYLFPKEKKKNVENIPCFTKKWFMLSKLFGGIFTLSDKFQCGFCCRHFNDLSFLCFTLNWHHRIFSWDFFSRICYCRNACWCMASCVKSDIYLWSKRKKRNFFNRLLYLLTKKFRYIFILEPSCFAQHWNCVRKMTTK